jgi:RimJ/RimL family protein N-acetyltransferase
MHGDGDQAVVVGRASHAAILDAATVAREMIASPEDTPWVATALPDWKIESALLFRRDARSPLPKTARGVVRFLAAPEIAEIARGGNPLVPGELADELRSAERAGAPIAVSLENGRPAAFCYAGSLTETLWDVSIDTLAPYQRRGHATEAVKFLIEYYRALGKEPVWGALVSNAASIGLAKRLGFARVDSLSILSAPTIAAA